MSNLWIKLWRMIEKAQSKKKNGNRNVLLVWDAKLITAHINSLGRFSYKNVFFVFLHGNNQQIFLKLQYKQTT